MAISVDSIERHEGAKGGAKGALSGAKPYHRVKFVARVDGKTTHLQAIVFDEPGYVAVRIGGSNAPHVYAGKYEADLREAIATLGEFKRERQPAPADR